MGVVDQMSSIVHNSSGGQARTPYNSQHFLPLPYPTVITMRQTQRDLRPFMYIHVLLDTHTHC